MPQHGISRTARDFRVDGHRQRNPPVDFEKRLDRPDPRRRAPRGMRTLAEDGWRLVPPGHHHGRGGVERDDRERSRERDNDRFRRENRGGRLNLISHATFQYKGLQADGSVAEGQLDAPGRPDAFRQMEALGLRPVNLFEKAGRRDLQEWRPSARPRFRWERFPSNLEIAQSFREGFPGKFHAAAVESAGRGRAVEPRAGDSFYKEASSPGGAGQSGRKSTTSCGRHVAGRCDGEIAGLFRAFTWRWSRRARPADFSTWCWRRSRISVARKGTEIESHHRDDLSVHPVRAGAGGADGSAVFFIPKFQKLFQFARFAAVDHANHHWRQPSGAFLWILCPGGLCGHRGFCCAPGLLRKRGKRIWEGLVALPLVGPLVAQFAMARFCRMLGTLLGAGVPLVQGLNVARKSIGNQILVDAVSASPSSACSRVDGSARAWRIARAFSGSTLEMISVAEESGTARRRTGPHRRRHRGRFGPQFENRRGVCRAADAVFDCRFIGTIFIGMLLPILSMSEYIK
jgi:type II secretory pathway component PulF